MKTTGTTKFYVIKEDDECYGQKNLRVVTENSYLNAVNSNCTQALTREQLVEMRNAIDEYLANH